jgi:hypothetical protein
MKRRDFITLLGGAAVPQISVCLSSCLSFPQVGKSRRADKQTIC